MNTPDMLHPWNVLVFDIETVPDVASGSALYGLEGLSDQDAARAMATQQLQKTGNSSFLPLHLHRIVAISVVARKVSREGEDSFTVCSLGDEDSSEKKLIKQFYDGINRYTPTLVSWNGGNFDLPVLHYRSLLNAVPAKKYWETGNNDQQFRFNNYLNRFHWRHIDLMDVIAGFSRAVAPLTEIAVMLGFPGKLGMSGGDVWDTYLDGGIKRIRHYCEADSLNTYLIYLNWEMVRGTIDKDQFNRECDLVKEKLKISEQEHLLEFLDVWDSGACSADK